MKLSAIEELRKEIFCDPFFGEAASFALERLGDINGKKIVDIGCGSGIISIFFALKGARVIGIDIEEESLEKAKKSMLEFTLKDECIFLQGSAESLPIDSRTIDIVFSRSTIQYMRRQVVIDEYIRILKPGATLVLLENLPFNPFINMYRLKRKFFAKTPEEVRYVNSVLGYLTFSEINQLKDSFEKVIHKEYYLFSVFAIYLLPYKKHKIIANVVNLILELDRLLLSHVGFTRYFAWYTAILCQSKIENKSM